jgi:hypothetical protein
MDVSKTFMDHGEMYGDHVEMVILLLEGTVTTYFILYISTRPTMSGRVSQKEDKPIP